MWSCRPGEPPGPQPPGCRVAPRPLGPGHGAQASARAKTSCNVADSQVSSGGNAVFVWLIRSNRMVDSHHRTVTCGQATRSPGCTPTPKRSETPPPGRAGSRPASPRSMRSPPGWPLPGPHKTRVAVEQEAAAALARAGATRWGHFHREPDGRGELPPGTPRPPRPAASHIPSMVVLPNPAGAEIWVTAASAPRISRLSSLGRTTVRARRHGRSSLVSRRGSGISDPLRARSLAAIA